jgi:two-component system nitrogen regulation sensor histidine kinase NtrY
VEAIEAREIAGEHIRTATASTLHPREADQLSSTDRHRRRAAEDRERLTEPYMTTRVRGTGLGLAIVKKIVEEHLARSPFSTGGGGTASPHRVRRRPARSAGNEEPRRGGARAMTTNMTRRT